jgi:hypothetical protein
VTKLEMAPPPLGRALLFLIGCIGTRAAVAYAAAVVNTKYLQYLGLLALGPVIGWIYIIATGSRQSGPEAGGRIWWDGMRPIHAAIWAGFALTALNGWPNAYLFLVADVILGLGNWIQHYFI